LDTLSQAAAAARPTAADPVLPPTEEAAAPRRWSDSALADVAGLSTTMACECPRHVAELLLQLSHFEAYSAECEHRSPADAQIHAYLKRVAGLARASFETALEQVAMHEGLILLETAPHPFRSHGGVQVRP